MLFSIRMIGALCILAASMLTGVQADRRMKQKCTFLQEMYELLRFLEKEMTYHRSPIQESFRSAAESCTTVLRAVLFDAAERIEKREGSVFRKLWAEAVEQNITREIADGEVRAALLDAADALCNTDTVMQRTLLEKHAARFGELYQAELEAYREKSLLYRRLCAAAGVFCVILLI